MVSKVFKTAIKLKSFNDLIRFSVNMFNILGLKNPYIYVLQDDDEWIYFVRLSHYLPIGKPLVVTYYCKTAIKPIKPYIEYTSERRESIKFAGTSDLTNPAANYVAIYHPRKFNALSDPFLGDNSGNVIVLKELSSDFLHLLHIEDYRELIRIASDAKNVVMVTQQVQGDTVMFTYITGFPLPIIPLILSDINVPLVLISRGPSPSVNKEFASFAKYVERDVEEEYVKFTMGTDKFGRYVPLIYIETLPFFINLK